MVPFDTASLLLLHCSHKEFVSLCWEMRLIVLSVSCLRNWFLHFTVTKSDEKFIGWFWPKQIKVTGFATTFFFLMLANILTIVVSCHKRLFRDDIPTLKTRTALLSQLCAREMPPCWTADMAHVWRHSPGRDGGRWPHPIMAPCRSYTSFPFTIAVIRYVHLLVLRLLVGQRVCFTFFLFTYLIGCVSKLKWLNLVRFMLLTSAALWRRLPWR